MWIRSEQAWSKREEYRKEKDILNTDAKNTSIIYKF